MRLKKAQKDALLEWIAAGKKTDEINEMAAIFEPPFDVSRQQVDGYRKRRAVDVQAIIAKDERSALATGLATRETRVARLVQLAELIEVDLFGERLWTRNVKGVGSGDIAEIVDYEEFNKAEVDAYRGVLDDIAKEVGQRVAKQEVTSKDWRSEIIEMLKAGQLKPADVEKELGKDLATELFIAAGVPITAG